MSSFATTNSQDFTHSQSLFGAQLSGTQYICPTPKPTAHLNPIHALSLIAETVTSDGVELTPSLGDLRKGLHSLLAYMMESTRSLTRIDGDVVVMVAINTHPLMDLIHTEEQVKQGCTSRLRAASTRPSLCLCVCSVDVLSAPGCEEPEELFRDLTDLIDDRMDAVEKVIQWIVRGREGMARRLGCLGEPSVCTL